MAILKDKLNLCVVGLGEIFEQYHLPSIIENSNLQISSVVDVNLDLVEKIKRQTNADGFDHLSTAAVRDVCLITTPPTVREEIIIPALKSGMHIVCEKPISFAEGEARRMFAVAESQHKKILVAQTRRYFPNIRLLRSLLRTAVLNPPIRLNISEGGIYGWKSAGSDRAMSNPRDAGVIHDEGSHVFDLVSLFLNDLGVGIDDISNLDVTADGLAGANNCRVTFDWKSGNLYGHVTVTLSRTLALSNRISISGQNVAITTRSLCSDRIELETHEGRKLAILGNEGPNVGLNHAFSLQWEGIVSQLLGMRIDQNLDSLDLSTVLPSLKLIDLIIQEIELGFFDPVAMKWTI